MCILLAYFTEETIVACWGKIASPCSSSLPSDVIVLSHVGFSSVQLLSRVRLYNPMDRSTPGLPFHHQLPESTETHENWIGDAIQPSHSLSSPSPPALNVSQYHGFSNKSALRISGQSAGVSASTSVLPMYTQDWSPLGWTSWISWQSKGLSRIFSNTTVQEHQFFGAQLSL